ncbi:Heme oxygenase 1 [Eufriesea mexicana]|uniref:Heme oxygenase n=1 Tax=Eufriesea mexicana TaxID=516756 RepID=A0A310SFS4_9HYME|nr:PREDICTED: heme oxygenase 2 [Eufriesea mexicana]OAD60242.1 Heme oxygenase 1 [Eufriesea mexicana]
MTNKGNDTFCKKMRQATKEIHTISDTLVNAKLAFGFLDNSVWADGLLVFYEIFQYLEFAMIRWKHTEIGLFLHDQLRRTEAFESDLEFYLGKEWIKSYSPRDSVTRYLIHLKKIEDTDPILLIAYIYHLYMGLLSGGIILRKKRQLMQKIWPFQACQMNGNNITNFGTSNIFELKQYVRDTMNNIAETLDEDTKNKLIEESKTVFALNNEIIRSVRGTGTVFFKKIMYFVIPVMILLLALIASFKKI